MQTKYHQNLHLIFYACTRHDFDVLLSLVSAPSEAVLTKAVAGEGKQSWSILEPVGVGQWN